MEDISKVELSYGKKRTKELVKVAIILNITLIELISKIKKMITIQRRETKTAKQLKT